MMRIELFDECGTLWDTVVRVCDSLQLLDDDNEDVVDGKSCCESVVDGCKFALWVCGFKYFARSHRCGVNALNTDAISRTPLENFKKSGSVPKGRRAERVLTLQLSSLL